MKEVKKDGRFKKGDGRFKPGVSGNPGGRPKGVYEARERAAAHCVEAIDILIEMMRDTTESSKIRIQAIFGLLDRGMGKPAQSLHISEDTSHKDIIDMTSLELEVLKTKGIEAAVKMLYKEGKLGDMLKNVTK